MGAGGGENVSVDAEDFGSVGVSANVLGYRVDEVEIGWARAGPENGAPSRGKIDGDRSADAS